MIGRAPMTMKNMAPILRNAAFLFSGNVIGHLIVAAVTIIVARYLGPADYGALSVGISFASVTGYFTDLGLTQTMIREGSRGTKDSHSAIVASAFKIRGLLAGTITLCMFPVSALLIVDEELRRIVLAVVIPTIWGGTLQGAGAAYFQMTQQMEFTALIRVVAAAINAVAMVVGLVGRWPVEFFALGYGLSSVLGGLVSVTLLKRHLRTIRGWHRGLLDELGSFTFGGLAVMLLPQLGPMILQRVSTLEQVGYFSVALRIPSLLYKFPGTVAAAFYPQLFFYGRRNPKEHLDLNVTELRLMALAGAAMAIPLCLYPDLILELLFGAEWSSGDTLLAFSLVAWLVAMQSINYPLADGLTTKGLQARRTLVLWAAIVIGAVAYWKVGAQLGAVGAAIVALGLELFLSIGFAAANPEGGLLMRRGLSTALAFVTIGLGLGKMVQLASGGNVLGATLTILMIVTLLLVMDGQIRQFASSIYRGLHRLDSSRREKREVPSGD